MLKKSLVDSKPEIMNFSKKEELKNPNYLILNSTYLTYGFGILRDSKIAKSDNWDVVSFVSCRETFQNQSSRIRRFLYGNPAGNQKNIAAFIYRIENMLGLKTHCQFGPTQYDNIMWIKITPWWSNYSMHRSFFTMMLRVGHMYDIKLDNFEQTLYSHTFTTDTKFAVNRFLKGYTRYTGKVTGWYNQFARGGSWYSTKPSAKKVRELLIKP